MLTFVYIIFNFCREQKSWNHGCYCLMRTDLKCGIAQYNMRRRKMSQFLNCRLIQRKCYNR